ncbi:MAG: CDP-diacylglycerol--serine O-phosphatidyltransferase [Deltaproteobacteria bacterium]|nr:CDP-diacylglycerol--serine O-phosphatidyltransferase [Deltaproteobacteria bacterium]
MRVLPGRKKGAPPLQVRRGVYILPNLVTSLGLFCGFFSVISTIKEAYLPAAIAILVALVFDALDGRVARLTKTSSQFGVEYDSLSDVIAFGVAPGVLAYRWALEPWGVWGWLAASLYVICGALRLARFNVQVDIADKKNFVGLPIPAAAAVIATTILMYFFLGGEGATNKHITLLLLIYALAALMVSSIPYYSFKEVHLYKRQPFWTLLLSIVAIQLTIAEPQIMLFSVFSLYAVSGPVRMLIRFVRTGKLYDKAVLATVVEAPYPRRSLDTDEESSL